MSSLEVQVVKLEGIVNSMADRLKEMNSVVLEIRGHNGDPGLVGRIIIVERGVTRLTEVVEELSEQVRKQSAEKHVCLYEDELQQMRVKDAVDEKTAKVDEERNVSWTWIRDKIITPVVIAAITYMLFTFFPKLLALLGQSPTP